MLTFKKGGYDYHQLYVLRNIIRTGIDTNVPCDSCCETCRNRAVCGDVNRLIRHIEVLLPEHRNFEENC